MTSNKKLTEYIVLQNLLGCEYCRYSSLQKTHVRHGIIWGNLTNLTSELKKFNDIRWTKLFKHIQGISLDNKYTLNVYFETDYLVFQRMSGNTLDCHNKISVILKTLKK